jgi:hypothetical protein
MDGFSMTGAWSFGWRFLAPRLAGHAVILVGIGILVPFALQYAVGGGAAATMSPSMLSETGIEGLVPGRSLLIVMTLGYLLQTASYFASWRLGFDAGRSLPGAILYGLVAGLIAMVVVAVVTTLALLGAARLWTPEAVLLGALIALIPIGAVAALFYTTIAALAAAFISLLLVAAMAFGTATGQVGLAATLVGGRGDLVVVVLVMSGVSLWLAARFSCTASAMANAGSFNLIAAARISWRLTWEEQWAILRYLALIGFALALVMLGAAIAAGAGAAALLEEGGAPTLQLGAIVLRLALAVPLAFLTVMVPAGIYRELNRAEVSAEVFA